MPECGIAQNVRESAGKEEGHEGEGRDDPCHLQDTAVAVLVYVLGPPPIHLQHQLQHMDPTTATTIPCRTETKR